MLNKKETNIIIETLQPDGHWMGNFLSTDNENSRSGAHCLTVSTMIHDLILLTSFLCTSSLDAAKSKPSAKGKESTQTKTAQSSENWILFLAPYWAIVAILSQPNIPSTDESIKVLQMSLQSVLKSSKHMNSSTEYVDEILTRIAQASSTSNGNVPLKRVFNRIRRALKSHLRTILLFGVFFSLALHSDLISLSSRFSELQHFQKIDSVDSLSVAIIDLITECIPRLCYIPDSIGTEASPLSYCAAYRDSVKKTSFMVQLELCKVLTKRGSSVVALADRTGMCPLHYAARKGETAVVEYLVQNFPYSASFKDSTGKLPIHHALLNWRNHTPEVISLLAEKVPLVLLPNQYNTETKSNILKSSSLARSSAPFKPLQYAEKNCSPAIFMNLTSIVEQFTSSTLYSFILSSQQAQEKVSSSRSPTSTDGSSGCDSSSFLSSTDGEGDGSSLGESQTTMDDEEYEDETQEDSISGNSSTEGKSCSSEQSSDQEQMLLLHFANSLLMLQASSPDTSSAKISGSSNNKRSATNDSELPHKKRSKKSV